ncbi:pyridoxal-phosphate dependent enzyme [Halieaceae bacterium IMCC14734]|uniref:Pyridoxal-phosphate dependent enzyme n=1 Tax=Candidatus Litorirhabdus singularis TaxID=2518993 RepID=A0ABT3TKK2_9GAMM|nr:pyridoxal-phosphate dependent enzyme [Candidatus Litorirhabdus singularis]MCX2982310.1 pyridoxal-phosphate dependent enzyme [Candidatus Litorirhabdus singularis]
MSADAIVQPLSPALVAGTSLKNCRMLRLDLLNAPASGNKFYKLQHYLTALEPGQTLVSFGGAWSNHIHALAAVGHARGFPTVGIIRGDANAPLSATLQDAKRWGMQLEFVSRGDYRRRHDPVWLAAWQQRLGHCLMVPEGGAGLDGAKGCGAIADLIMEHYAAAELVGLAAGTGCTLAGLAAALPADKQVLGVVVLKGAGEQLRSDIGGWIAGQGGVGCHWHLEEDYHGGGYARCDPKLAEFIEEFEQVQGIPLEPVYTGKLMYALYQMIANGRLNPATRVLALHTGGLQGRRGFPQLGAAPE